VDEEMSEMMKVTVIATGFERVREEHAESLRRATQQTGPSQRSAPPSVEQQLVPPPVAAHSQVAVAARRGPPQPPPLQVRDDIRFPKRSDADWDVPTFQRRMS